MSKTETQLTLKKRKQNPDDGELDITPMIDITFLLLAFFVVVSKMDPQQAVDLPRATFGVSVQDKDSVVVIVGKTETGTENQIFLGRSKDPSIAVTATDPEAIEEAVADYIQGELSANPEKDAVMIKAEGNVKVGLVETVRKGIAKAELSESRKLYAGIKEEQK